MINDNLVTSPIIIGTWQLAGDYWGLQNHSNSLKTIHAALRSGFIEFDTSPDYGKGRSEQLLGQQLKNKESIISTKSFIKPLPSVEKSVYNSLKRLNRDYIDNFFIHWPSTKMDSKPMMELLEKLRSKGVIHNIGVSNFNIDQLKDIENAGKVDIIQNPYNLFWIQDQKYFEYCKNKGIQTQGYSVLAQGLLTGKFNKNNPWEPKDDRHKMVLFSNENLKIIYNYVETLQNIANKENISFIELIIKWTTSKSYIDKVVIGCRTRKQIESLNKIDNKKLTTPILSLMDNLSLKVSTELNLEKNIFNHSY